MSSILSVNCLQFCRWTVFKMRVGELSCLDSLKQLDVKLEKEIAYTNNLRKLETSKLETNLWHAETQLKAK